MLYIFLALLLSESQLLVTCRASLASNYTVTHEGWFDFVVKWSNDAQEHDFRSHYLSKDSNVEEKNSPHMSQNIFEPFTGRRFLNNIFHLTRVTIALFGEVAPITVLNFKLLSLGYEDNKRNLTYKGSRVTRIVPDFVVQMGDVIKGDGTGSTSIFGQEFVDEKFILSHRSAGWVSMANHGPDTNGCQFFVLLVKARWLDKKHVVFGKVIRGFDLIHRISEIPTFPNQKPIYSVTVENCGVRKIKKPYELPQEALDTTEDFVTPSWADPIEL